jgi:hypothetical protein
MGRRKRPNAIGVPGGSDIGDSRLGVVQSCRMVCLALRSSDCELAILGLLNEFRLEDGAASNLLFHNFQTKVD